MNPTQTNNHVCLITVHLQHTIINQPKQNTDKQPCLPRNCSPTTCEQHTNISQTKNKTKQTFFLSVRTQSQRSGQTDGPAEQVFASSLPTYHPHIHTHTNRTKLHNSCFPRSPQGRYRGRLWPCVLPAEARPPATPAMAAMNRSMSRGLISTWEVTKVTNKPAEWTKTTHGAKEK